jgi:ubiquinone/menaquinone biosynthesis C-methylase UbiE
MVGEVSDRYVPAAGRAVLTPLYDAVNAVAMRQGRWRPRLVERALSAGAAPRILDLGCGTGEMALAEVWRVLRPGGWLLVCDVGRAGDPVMRDGRRPLSRGVGAEGCVVVAPVS